MSEDVDFEEAVAFKTKDLFALGGGQDQLNIATEHQVSALLYSSSAGILELKLPQTRLKPEMQQIFSDAPIMKSELAAKLEQIVFFNSSSEHANPIALKMQQRGGSEEDWNRPALELSASISSGAHPQLPNVFDETTFLNETCHRCHEIVVAFSKNDLIKKVLIANTALQKLAQLPLSNTFSLIASCRNRHASNYCLMLKRWP